MALTAIGAMKVVDPAKWERAIRAAMRKSKGRITEASADLGVSTRTLFRWPSEPPLEDVPKAVPSLHIDPQPAKKPRRAKAKHVGEPG